MRALARRVALALFSTVGLLCGSGCGNPHEERAVEAIAILGSISDELSKITDAASVEAAKPRLEELGNRWRANERKQSSLKPPGRREMAELAKKYAAQLDSAVNRYDSERKRVKKIDGGPEALAALGNLTGQGLSRND
ncbi:MAG TPA: hypothetical protein VKE94_21930 [Gemmataceae bacterium]|nr:hypothetical protein [Gemmataceae bacterium]